MRTVKPKGWTPISITKAVFHTLLNMNFDKARQFSSMVEQSVDLHAKNTRNFASRDLACQQVCDLAKMYGVEVER